MQADRRGNPFPKAFPIGEGGSRVPRKRETDEGFLQHANISECKMRTWIGDIIASRPTWQSVLLPSPGRGRWLEEPDEVALKPSKRYHLHPPILKIFRSVNKTVNNSGRKSRKILSKQDETCKKLQNSVLIC